MMQVLIGVLFVFIVLFSVRILFYFGVMYFWVWLCAHVLMWVGFISGYTFMQVFGVSVVFMVLRVIFSRG